MGQQNQGNGVHNWYPNDIHFNYSLGLSNLYYPRYFWIPLIPMVPLYLYPYTLYTLYLYTFFLVPLIPRYLWIYQINKPLSFKISTSLKSQIKRKYLILESNLTASQQSIMSCTTLQQLRHTRLLQYQLIVNPHTRSASQD